MSYADIAAMVEDWELRMRLVACAAIEQHDAPVPFVEENIWRVCAQLGWNEAWGKALASHADDEDYKPGADHGVISDAMILSGTRKVIGDLETKAAVSARAVTKDNDARIQAEDDREFARQTRLRKWEIDHQPRAREASIVHDTEGDPIS